MEKYYYSVYGETVVCDFEIPELRKIEPTDQVTMEVCLESIPEEILSGYSNPNQIYASKDKVCFRIEKVGYYYIQEGTRISIQCFENFDPYSRKTFTLGSAMGIALILKGRIPIHGGTVSHHGKALIVTGDSGAGKSTISTALRFAGMGFVADDVSVLDRSEDGIWMVQPAYPQAKLCRDAALHFGYDLEKLIYIDEQRDKFAIRLKDNYETEAIQLGAFVELQLGEETQEEDLIVKEVTGHEKLFCLRNNIYRGFVYELIGMKPTIMKQCLEVLTQVPIYRIIRKPGVNTEDKIVETIKGLV